MGELEPSRQSQRLEELRTAMLRPHAARMVLWSAGLRIVGDQTFLKPQLRQAGRYLETIFGALDAIEKQDRRLVSAGHEPSPVLLDMGGMMSWACLEVRNAEFHNKFDPTNRVHQGAAMHMQLTIGAVEHHLTEAYRQYMAYEEAQAQDPTQTDVNWH